MRRPQRILADSLAALAILLIALSAPEQSALAQASRAAEIAVSTSARLASGAQAIVASVDGEMSS